MKLNTKHYLYVLLCGLVGFTSLIQPASAARVILHNGSEFTGTIQLESEDAIELQLNPQSVIILKRTKIAQIIPDVAPAPIPEAPLPEKETPPEKVAVEPQPAEVTAAYSNEPTPLTDEGVDINLSKYSTMSLITGAFGFFVALAFLFKPFFGDLSGFMDCLKYWLKPNFLSLFQGDYMDDIWSEFKLFIWLLLGLTIGLACTLGSHALSIG